ncbi:CRISPR-associated helicase Cas3' [Chitinophaga defluvii]|uniref:CRISPR-associated helicase Cas3 n=1 Tax=Chitinophaga defluvii TaxID=3163343 RepID=A0ABV2T1M7_9BACT
MSNPVFYSHSIKTPSGKTGSKQLQVHNAGVNGIGLKSLYKQLGFRLPLTVIEQLLSDILLLHDLGKYTQFFQDYLLKTGRSNGLLKQHARIGAYVIHEKYKNTHPELALFGYFTILSHHGNLSNIYDCAAKEHAKREDYKWQFAEQRKSLLKHLDQIQEELSFGQLNTLLAIPDFRKCRNEVIPAIRGKSADIQHYYLINYLFSLLIEADKLDASDTPLYTRVAIAQDLVDKRLANSTNALRNSVRKTVIEKLEIPDLLSRWIFTLTAPTGTGKTLIALDFALKLREKVHKATGHLPSVIYGLPFVNIIEQAFDEYKQTIPEDQASILAHYQYADIFGDQEEAGDKTEEEMIDEKAYHRKLMQLDTWQADIVITSFVQFFQTLIGNRNKILKKFNHLAGAIIILDEVQTLSLEKIPLIGASLYYLSKFLGTRILLMTATRPQIFELAYREIFKDQLKDLDEADRAFFNNGHPTYLELLHNNQDIYKSYRRTCIIPLLDSTLTDEQDFIDTCFSQYWQAGASCIFVVNKVSRSIALFEAVKTYLSANSYNNPVYYLSTNITPYQRFEVIKQIKEDLKAKRRPLLISTQVVEAGVDLNFDMGFRDIAPIDAIIQVAGRINREANPQQPEKPHLPLYIVDFGDCKAIYSAITYLNAQAALANKSIVHEAEYLTLVNEYFSTTSASGGFDYSREIFNAMKTLNYDKGPRSVADFRIIEEQKNVRAVFIESDEAGSAALAAYRHLLDASDIAAANKRKLAFDLHYKQIFNQRIISVPFYHTQDLLPVHDKSENILLVDRSIFSARYDQHTGFKRDKGKEKESNTIFF